MSIGVDILEISKIRKLMKNEKFLNRFFSDAEISYIESSAKADETCAGIFAAKEAIIKALNGNLAGLQYKDISIERKNDVPFAYVNGINFFVSISHDGDYAISIASTDETLSKITIEDEFKVFRKRDDFTHKGDYGKLAIFAGSLSMTGAPYFASLAAMRTGCGLSYLYVDKDIQDILSVKLSETIIRCNNNYALADMDAVLFGPAWSFLENRDKIYKDIIHANKKLVIDADGLHYLKKYGDKLGYRAIITPHFAELARLLDIEIEKIIEEPKKYARLASEKFEVVVVLKGHNTIVMDKDNEYINHTGNPGMATAGSGDVLSGIIASLLVQGFTVFDAAKYGVYLHGLAGDLAKEKYTEYSLIASDIIEFIPKAIKMMEVK